MKYTQFAHAFASVGALGETDDLKDLCSTLIKANGRDRKMSQPLIKWAVFEGCRRLKKDIRELYCIEIEHDAGSMTITEACVKLHDLGYPYFAYETWSCTDEHPRWRMFLPLEKPLLYSELGSVEAMEQAHGAFVNGVAAVLGDGVLSRESYYLSQNWYVGHQIGGRDLLMLTNL